MGGVIYFTLDFYLDTFPGSFSKKHSDWGNFGSYFNGVITPVISAFSLIAVLFTVYMQKKLLVSQQKQNFTLTVDRKKSEYINIVHGRIDSIKVDIEVSVRKLELERELNKYTGSVKKEDVGLKSVEITNKFVREIAIRNDIRKSYLSLITWVHTVPEYEVFHVQTIFVDKLKKIHAKERNYAESQNGSNETQ